MRSETRSQNPVNVALARIVFVALSVFCSANSRVVAYNSILTNGLTITGAGDWKLNIRRYPVNAVSANTARNQFTRSVLSGLVLIICSLTTIACNPAERPDRPGVAVKVPVSAKPQAAGTSQAATPDKDLYICRMDRVSNAPLTDSSRKVRHFKPLISVQGVPLMAVPAKNACLSSGYGDRITGSVRKSHCGVDYQQKPAGNILAAADGVIVERDTRSDYGNYLLVDHGNGVYTRYAHLASFHPGVQAGAEVSMGNTLGMMGSTGGTSAVHLHFEILTGKYNGNSFLLTRKNPFAYMHGAQHHSRNCRP